MKLSASPKPRPRERAYHEFNFPIVSARRLPPPGSFPNISCADALAARQSERDFKSPLDEPALSSLLWHTCRTIRTERERGGFVWQHRTVPSAGGRHPIHLVILERRRNQITPKLYIPEDHRLAMIEAPIAPIKNLLKVCNQVVEVRRATVIWFAAEVARTASKYQNAESLIWRDAGALVATFNLVASALGLGCCALGLTGEPYVSRYFQSRGAVVGVGGCVIGIKAKIQ